MRRRRWIEFRQPRRIRRHAKNRMHIDPVERQHATRIRAGAVNLHAPDLRLETFTRLLLNREEKHRALDDALDALGVLGVIAAGARDGVPRYQAVSRSRPFTVITPSSSKRTNATFGGDAASSGPEVVEINPSDAKAAAITDGILVEVSNDKGSVTLKAKLTDAVAPGILYSPKGTWLRTSDTGQTQR